MFEKVTVCHLLPQRTGTGDNVVAGEEANWHGKVSGGRGRLCSSAARDARMETPEGSSWGREGRCSCEQKDGKAPRERTEGRLEKGQKLDATLERGANVEINTHTRTPTHPPSAKTATQELF